jgi:sulfur-carrier protein
VSTVTFRLFGAARAAAGVSEVVVPAGPARTSVAVMSAGKGLEFERVLGLCSILCDGAQLDRTSTDPLVAGSVCDVLPPFAGG